MSIFTKTRRLPTKVSVHPGGTTEVFYSTGENSFVPEEAKPEAWQFVSRSPASSTLEGSQLAPSQGVRSYSFDFPVVSLSSFAQSPANELSSLRYE